MDAAAGEIVEQGVVRLPLEDVAQMALADAKVLGNRGHADAGVVVVCADIVHGLQDIAALVPLFWFGQGGSGGGGLGGHPLLEIADGLFQISVVEGL